MNASPDSAAAGGGSPDGDSPDAGSLELNLPVFTERGGEEIVGRYRVHAEVLHVAVGRYSKSARLHGSNPEVLAHVLLDALVDEILRRQDRESGAAAR